MTSKYKLINVDRIKSLKREIDSLANENRELKKRIIELEKEKSGEKDNHNIIEEKIYESLDDILRKYNQRKSSEDVDLDMSYWPKRRTAAPYYPYPGYPQVGDWPPGPQIGDTPHNPLPDDYRPYPFAWWGIYPPEWNWQPSPNTINTNTSGDYKPQECHTVSSTEEK